MFLVIRVPLMWRQPGGLDEEFYATPGLAILKDGVPRAPHIPQRDPGRVFYLADQAFFVEPPLSFYWQALFFAVLPDTYGAARLASGVAALATICLVYELGRVLYRSEAAALWGAGLYSLMRTFYFPATTGRPDMLCTALGLGALLCLARSQCTRRRASSLVLTGVLLGLGGLTHPLALVYALQASGWLLFASRGWRRLGHPTLVAALALAVFTLWLPLMIRFPDEFRRQFLNHMHSGPGLLARLVLPWESLRFHAWMMSGHLGAVQFALLLGGTAMATAIACLSRQRGARRALPLHQSDAQATGAADPPSLARRASVSDALPAIDFRHSNHGPLVACLLAWSSVYLLSATAGVHPTQYYWCYPTALLCVCLGRAIAALAACVPARGRRRVLVNWAGGALLVALMLPGAGLRTWRAHLRHWNNIDYNAPAFAQRLLAELPADARCTVDREFVLDFLAAGRPTILAETFAIYFSAEQFPYDYLVISRHGLDENIADVMQGELVRTYGDRDDLFACYAEIYRPAPVPTPSPARRDERGD